MIIPAGATCPGCPPILIPILSSPDRDELITLGTKFHIGYDPMTGEELWRLPDGVDVKIPTPVAADSLIYPGGGSSHERRNFYALRSGAKGEIFVPGEEKNRTGQVRSHG